MSWTSVISEIEAVLQGHDQLTAIRATHSLIASVACAVDRTWALDPASKQLASDLSLLVNQLRASAPKKDPNGNAVRELEKLLVARLGSRAQGSSREGLEKMREVEIPFS